MRIQASSITYVDPFSSYPSIPTLPFASASANMQSTQFNSSSSIDNKTRCEGLDLLVKAAIHVAGDSFLSLPFVQRKVIRRRKKALSFNYFSTDESSKNEEEEEEEEEEEMEVKKEETIELSSSPKRRKRVMGLPSKFHDSVLQPWKVRTRRR